jgi:hypothetical protein
MFPIRNPSFEAVKEAYLTDSLPVEVGRGVPSRLYRAFSALSSSSEKTTLAACPTDYRRNLSDHQWLTSDERYRLYLSFHNLGDDTAFKKGPNQGRAFRHSF